eukprot:TRINITY_DN437_c0_g3_i1.p1 TRINITY_DN437_c0_g3~~TRINITY_DN437_c0_g3_i1.p1  ORF type:complete len:526 (+),score=213.75 TRINITY_DN437_c0_g3_i1:58-1635(+)
MNSLKLFSYFLFLLFFIFIFKTTTLVNSSSILNQGNFVSGIVMYEISTRPWLYYLTQKYNRKITRLADIPAQEFQSLADKGINMVWMMGVWSLGAYGLNHDKTDPGLLASYASVLPDYTQDDIIGSPYAITSYTCNPELGSDQDIATLRQLLHSMGLKLMLDFVPNHTAVDNPLTTTNPEYYIRAPKGSSPPYDPNIYLPNGIAYGSSGYGPWTDTAQLNYFNPDTRTAMVKNLLHIASLADGIRCDVAYLELNDLFQQNWAKQANSWGYYKPSTEFWSDAISQVKAQYPNVTFLAEVYNPYESTLQANGFDFTYDKTLRDKLGGGNLDDIRRYISGLSFNYLTHSAHFIANHDEDRAAYYFGTWWKANAAALITMTLPGMQFYWNGDFKGLTHKLDVHLRRETSEPAVIDSENFYNVFVNITTNAVFKYGTWTYLPVTGSDTAWRLMAWRWEYGNEKRACVLNFSDQQGSGRVILSNAYSDNGSDTIDIVDLLSGEHYARSASEMRTQGLFVVVDSWYGQIFSY